ncbi:MAG TPA: cytochrome c [Nitrospiria bacterium]|nr:cytochrome c [Nitrospiria bacterium]
MPGLFLFISQNSSIQCPSRYPRSLMKSFIAIPIMVTISLGSLPVFATGGVENDPCKVLVPSELLAQVKAMKNPLPSSLKIIDDGKAIYEGKGTCFTCHGLSGKGDGDKAKSLDPAPRNLTNPKFQDCKTDGEIFWVIRYGIPGTGIMPLTNIHTLPKGVLITDNEAWTLTQYVRTFKGK